MSEDQTVLEAALAAQREGRPAALAIVVETQGSVPRQAGSKMLVWPDGQIVGTVGGGQMEALVIAEAQAAMRDGQCRVFTYSLADLEAGDPGVCGGTVKVYVEPLMPPPTVLVIGCGHVGKVVAELAKWLGYRVTVCDDRPGYATPEQIPGMDGYVEAAPEELVNRVTVTPATYIVVVTRGLSVDETLLPALLKTPAPYIGLIGSRRRWALTVETLQAQGVSQTDLERVHAPIGLSIGAETPKEIAVSILAEIIQVQRGGSGQSLRWSPPHRQAAPSGQ
ncbi:MAG: XdhC/CoxI family protein [Anaerolineae bacterium]